MHFLHIIVFSKFLSVLGVLLDICSEESFTMLSEVRKCLIVVVKVINIVMCTSLDRNTNCPVPTQNLMLCLLKNITFHLLCPAIVRILTFIDTYICRCMCYCNERVCLLSGNKILTPIWSSSSSCVLCMFSWILWQGLCNNLDDNTVDSACKSSHLLCI